MIVELATEGITSRVACLPILHRFTLIAGLSNGYPVLDACVHEQPPHTDLPADPSKPCWTATSNPM